jgi:hypothetical protein
VSTITWLVPIAASWWASLAAIMGRPRFFRVFAGKIVVFRERNRGVKDFKPIDIERCQR